MSDLSSTVQFELRRISAADHDVWRALAQAYLEDQCLHLGIEDLSYLPTLLDLSWAKLMDPNEPHVAWFGIVEGEVAGLMQITIHPAIFQTGVSGYLSDLFVKPEYRRRKIAKCMLHELMTYAVSQGWGRMYWVTKADNEGAKQFYHETLSSEFLQYTTQLVRYHSW